MSPVTALVPTFRPFRPDSCSDPPRAIPPFRRYVALDLDADAVPVINYKKLKKDSDSRGGGAGGTSPTRGRNNDDPFPANAAIDARMGGGPPAPAGGPSRPQDKLPGGAGNHMAEVIRRIEGFYSAPRFQDSDEEEEDDDADDRVEDAASESDGEEDMVDDGRDPNDPAVIEEKKRKAAMRAAAKAAKKAKQQKRGGKNQYVEEWYDMDDDFIDDDELDEYFERTGRKDKLGGKGGDRFYVNAGQIEFVDDGTGHAQAEAAARRRAKKGELAVSGGIEWTEEMVEALKRGVAKHGRRWRTIKHDAEFEGWFRQFSFGAMRHKWRNIAKSGLVGGGGGGNVGTPPHPNESHPKGTNSAPSSGGRDEPAGGEPRGARENTVGGARTPSAAAAPMSGPGGDASALGGAMTYGLGVSGNWCAELNAAIDHVQAASVREGAPQKMADGRSPPLSDGMLAALEAVVRVVKIDFGAPVFPQGLLAEMMEFLEPFCSQATLGRNMNRIAKNLKGGAATAQPKAVANGVANGVLEPKRVLDVSGEVKRAPPEISKPVAPAAAPMAPEPEPEVRAPVPEVRAPVPEAYEEESEYV